MLRYKRNAFSIEETLEEDISTLVATNEAIEGVENAVQVVNLSDGVTANIEEVVRLISRIFGLICLILIHYNDIFSCPNDNL